MFYMMSLSVEGFNNMSILTQVWHPKTISGNCHRCICLRHIRIHLFWFTLDHTTTACCPFLPNKRDTEEFFVTRGSLSPVLKIRDFIHMKNIGYWNKFLFTFLGLPYYALFLLNSWRYCSFWANNWWHTSLTVKRIQRRKHEKKTWVINSTFALPICGMSISASLFVKRSSLMGTLEH